MKGRSKGIMPLLILVSLLLTSLVSGAASPVAEAAGTTYYVDSELGNDSAAGTSEASAWKTLTKANSMTFNPGDRILLKAGGVWINQYLDLKGSGHRRKPDCCRSLWKRFQTADSFWKHECGRGRLWCPTAQCVLLGNQQPGNYKR
ncbi:hypothetical protein HMSSN139_37680 [Paenibacillus sp. HMSSN-139]|nr:hypothetical protein HMSSN139_37680 [Paenibacillus sp. HMSSN-139]